MPSWSQQTLNEVFSQVPVERRVRFCEALQAELGPEALPILQRSLPPDFCHGLFGTYQISHRLFSAEAAAAEAHDETKTLILNLPDELLTDILRKVTRLGDGRMQGDIPVAYTCKRFYRNLIPILYEHVRFNSIPRRLELFQRAVYENPALGSFCKRLEIWPADYKQDDLALLKQIIPLFMNVTHLSIDDRDSPYDWEEDRDHDIENGYLFQYCTHFMPALQTLMMSARMDDPWNIRLVMQALRSRSLGQLNISCVAETGHDPPSWNNEVLGSCQIATLSLREWHESSEAMTRFIQSIDQLSSFTVARFRSQHYFDLPMFRPMLMKHKCTLVDLNIGLLPPEGRGRVLNVSDFHALKRLGLTRQQMDEDLHDAEGDAERLLAPNLEEFTWTFQESLSDWESLGDKEEQWLRTLATRAAGRASPDLTIRVSYRPGNPQRKSHGYVWDRLQRLQDEFKATTVSFKYWAGMSKEEWQTWAESFEGDEMPDWEDEFNEIDMFFEN